MYRPDALEIVDDEQTRVRVDRDIDRVCDPSVPAPGTSNSRRSR
jgi:hypothetical protein